MHYQTMDDLLGGQYFHNRNTYAEGNYADGSDEIYYDLRNKNGEVKEGDRFRYDYNLFMQKATIWAGLTRDKLRRHSFIAAKISGTDMWRDGKMQNGICKDFSYGKSGKAGFIDGGFKMGTNVNMGHGQAITVGAGYEQHAPQVNVAFVSPEMNNNFVSNLRNEEAFTCEFGYAVNNKWLQMNLTAYYTHTAKGTEWQNFYFDDINSFTYVSMTGVKKHYYGAELGAKFKVTSNFSINLLGSIAEAKYASNTDVIYMYSNKAEAMHDVCWNKGMRESSTPLAVVSLGLKYSIKGWYFNLNGNYYDRIYLSYSPNMRFQSRLRDQIDNFDPDGIKGTIDKTTPGQPIHPSEALLAQAKSNGGFMLDGSIGHTFRVAHHPLNVNLMVTNITNNRKFCTGGYEQSRSTNYTNKEERSTVNRTYNFQKNPKKFYAQGINFMLNLNYRF